jgi:hypothetical protein
MQPSLSAELLKEYAPTKKPDVGTLPFSFRQARLMDAVPNSDGVAVPESVNLPEIIDPSAGEVRFTTGLALLIVNVRKAVFDARPLESTK